MGNIWEIMKKIITLVLFLLQSFFASASETNTEEVGIYKPCGIFTEASFEDAIQYLGQIKSAKNNPYEHLLFLRTDSQKVGGECVVLVNVKLKLTEYIDKNKKQKAKEIRVCGENTSLLGTPDNLKAYLYQFVHQKLDACILN